jgi:hypothetical protein
MSQKTRPGAAEEQVVLRDGIEYEEVTHDDQVIGRAFKVSLIILVALLALGGGGWYWINRPEAVVPTTEIETTAPRALANDEVAPAVAFRDVTAAAVISFVHQYGAVGE